MTNERDCANEENQHQDSVSTRDRALQIMELCEGIHVLTERGDSDLSIRLLSERIQETAYEIVKAERI